MEKRYRILKAALKIFQIGDFYSVRIDSSSVTLQGVFNTSVVKTAGAHKFKGDISPSGYIILVRTVGETKIDITLT